MMHECSPGKKLASAAFKHYADPIGDWYTSEKSACCIIADLASRIARPAFMHHDAKKAHHIKVLRTGRYIDLQILPSITWHGSPMISSCGLGNHIPAHSWMVRYGNHMDRKHREAHHHCLHEINMTYQIKCRFTLNEGLNTAIHRQRSTSFSLLTGLSHELTNGPYSRRP